MKTKQILFFLILFAGFIIFASMRPENIPNNYCNFGINDTIDSLKNNTPISFDDLGFQDDLENANQDLENANQNLATKRAELEKNITELEKLIEEEKTKGNNVDLYEKQLNEVKIEFQYIINKK